MLIQLKNAAATLAAGKPLVFSRGVYGVCRAFSGGVGCWRTLFPGISARHEPRNVRKDQKDRTGTEHAATCTKPNWRGANLYESQIVCIVEVGAALAQLSSYQVPLSMAVVTCGDRW